LIRENLLDRRHPRSPRCLLESRSQSASCTPLPPGLPVSISESEGFR
jgi:hypothetical protein